MSTSLEDLRNGVLSGEIPPPDVLQLLEHLMDDSLPRKTRDEHWPRSTTSKWLNPGDTFNTMNTDSGMRKVEALQAVARAWQAEQPDGQLPPLLPLLTLQSNTDQTPNQRHPTT